MPKTPSIARKPLPYLNSCVILLLFAISFSATAPAQTDPDLMSSSSEQYSPLGKNRKADEPEVALTMKNEIQVKIPIKTVEMNACEAEIRLQYHQRDTLARVDTTIDQASCTDAIGEYSLRITLSDDDGDYSNLEFEEGWQQENTNLVELTRDYPIGENVSLRRVAVRSVRCECAESQPNPVDD